MSVMTDLLAPGTEIPSWSVPLSPTTIVSTAIATRDFQDVHHDRDIAQAAGSKDIFMNILTSTAYVERYVNDWVREQTGEGAVVRGIAIRLGAPAYPYDTLTFTGSVESVEGQGDDRVAVLKVTGSVSLGDHVIGTVKVALADGGRG